VHPIDTYAPYEAVILFISLFLSRLSPRNLRLETLPSFFHHFPLPKGWLYHLKCGRLRVRVRVRVRVKVRVRQDHLKCGRVRVSIIIINPNPNTNPDPNELLRCRQLERN
jgi:hypothetical protein